jgi:hypothetical protein
MELISDMHYMIKPGYCVKLPDGRIGRVRDMDKYTKQYRIRVRRKTSNTHQFVYFPASKLKVVPCPKGWMSVEGYNSYIKKTLAKMKARSKT